MFFSLKMFQRLSHVRLARYPCRSCWTSMTLIPMFYMVWLSELCPNCFCLHQTRDYVPRGWNFCIPFDSFWQPWLHPNFVGGAVLLFDWKSIFTLKMIWWCVVILDGTWFPLCLMAQCQIFCWLGLGSNSQVRSWTLSSSSSLYGGARRGYGCARSYVARHPWNLDKVAWNARHVSS